MYFLTLRAFFPLSLHVLFPFLVFFCTLTILFMSDPFRIEPVGKSWADIVEEEEEEEYNRLHSDSISSQQVHSLHNLTMPTKDKNKEEKESKQTRVESKELSPSGEILAGKKKPFKTYT